MGMFWQTWGSYIYEWVCFGKLGVAHSGALQAQLSMHGAVCMRGEGLDTD